MSPAQTQPDPHQLAAEIKRRARGLGFDLVGIAPAEPSKYRDYFRRWIDEGQAGCMHYLDKRFRQRVDPAAYVPDVAGVICVGLNYYAPLQPLPREQRGHHARVARYALGQDYHELMKHRLWDLADWLRAFVPGTRTRTCVDTAPVMEKEMAARAGVGWIGKNSCVVHPSVGSWLLLGEILTTVRLPVDDPAVDRCGTCHRCIDACPTGAITAPYQLDARRCISYLTIEEHGTIPADLQPQMGDWLYGCDVCQDVCPFNSRAPAATDPALAPRFPTGTIDVRDLLAWGLEDYSARLSNSAMKRIKLPVLQRNARIALENLERAGQEKTRDAE